MRVVLAMILVLLAAATALAFGSDALATTVTAAAVHVSDQRSEPALLLLSGSLLLGLGGAVRRLTA